MSKLYGESHRKLQREFDTERLANRIEERLFHEHVTPDDQAFIERMDMFFLATADREGRPNCSYKGGDPGFIRVLDPKTLGIPELRRQRHVSLHRQHAGKSGGGPVVHRFRETKAHAAQWHRKHCAGGFHWPAYPEAQFVVKVHVTQVFPNCPRYIHKMQVVERSSFVPRADVATPVPAWKRMEWSCDVLPKNDPALKV